MRGSVTLAVLARREAVLVSFLAAAAAVVALAGPLGASWLRVAGVVIAAVGALVRVGLALRRAWLEGKGSGWSPLVGCVSRLLRW